jgi:hypothetical protein
MGATMDEATLRKFCAVNDIRYYLLNPIRRDGFLYATNGHIAVCIPDNPEIDASNDETRPDFSFIHKAMAEITEFNPVSVEMPPPATCPTCGGAGFRVECPDCDGDGTFYHGDHEYDCKNCDGDGTLPADEGEKGTVPCSHCDSTGHDPFQTVRIGNSPFARRYVSMLKELPNAVIWTNPEKELASAFFKFDGGFGVVMPCRER